MPFLILRSMNTYKWMDTLGSAFWCYFAGIILAQLSFINHETQPLVTIIMKATIPLALPFFVFAKASTQKDLYTTILLQSFSLLLFSVILVSIIVGFIFIQWDPKAFYYAAMIAGTYIGGTINMAAIHQIFRLPEHDFLLMSTADTITGGIYLLMLLSFLPKFFAIFLRPSKKKHDAKLHLDKITFSFKDIMFLSVLAIVCVVLSYLPTQLFTDHWESMIFFSCVTIISWFMSKKVPSSAAKQSSAIGNYLLMIFCISIGAQLDLQILSQIPLYIFGLVLSVLLGSIILHVFLAKVFKVERDIFLFSHVAGIFGPVFIPPIANVLARSDLLISGLGLAILGNILGNFVGMFVFKILSLLGS